MASNYVSIMTSHKEVFCYSYFVNRFKVSDTVKRFPGEHGWHYIELDQSLSKAFRPLIKEKWPALLNATFTLRNTTWKSSIMPIKDGPLFIALPAKVRKAEGVDIDQKITVTVVLHL